MRNRPGQKSKGLVFVVLAFMLALWPVASRAWSQVPDQSAEEGAVAGPRRMPPTPKAVRLPRVDDEVRNKIAPSETYQVLEREEFVPVAKKSPAPTDEVLAAAPPLVWEQPETLFEQLAGLTDRRETVKWATAVEDLVRKLIATESRQDAQPLIDEMHNAAAAVEPIARLTEDVELRVKLRRAGHALRRRLDVWERLVQFDGRMPAEATMPAVDRARLAEALLQIDTVTSDSPEGSLWRNYLLLDELRKQNESQKGLPRELAERVLKRLASPSLSFQQRAFLASGPFAVMGEELYKAAAVPVEADTLLTHLEEYERSGLASDGRLLARDCRSLAVSTDEQRRDLARYIDGHYRNANLRVAVSERLLNMLMPDRDPELMDVNDTIMGHQATGQSLTSTSVGVELLPSADSVSLALKIDGQIDSLTKSSSGPATFYNDSQSRYIAIKPMQVDLDGIHTEPAKIRVANNTRLHKLQTDYDDVPLLGAMVRKMAESQHSDKREEVSGEIKRKVFVKAKQRVDSESDERLGNVSERMQEHVVKPMHTLQLAPSIIQANTTEEKFAMRLRLAGDDQLAANTPRPSAPEGSLASFQVHQSAVNNLLEHLNLAGRTFTMPELAAHISSGLNLAKPWEVDPSTEDVKISFAAKDPIRVSLAEGKAELWLVIDRLSKGSRVWRDFTVRVNYEPDIDGREVELKRDGIIRLSGKRLSTGSQIALRGVFSRIFSKRHGLPLTPKRLTEDPKLADIAVTQVTIDDGWLGYALGEQRTAGRAGLLKK